ncbi:MAG TPA: hypothetical protein VJ647_06830 [Chitinophagaceae bacterium]|nr:hypothetical protein [Chitinophagaceae bacterium]
MEKPVAQASSPVNVKAVAKDLNTPSFSVNMIPLQDSEKNKLMLIIENPDKRKLRVSIEGPSNWNIYNEGTTKEEYRKLFDFTQAEDGIYTLVIADGKKKMRKQININTYREQVTRKMEITEAQ